MKVIDLLNKIANDEEVPKKIEYQGTEYVFDENDYKLYKGANLLTEDCLTSYINAVMLNDEVEIIEEDKEIEKLNLDTDNLKGKETVRAIDYLIEGKINELIDEVNELKGEKENERK